MNILILLAHPGPTSFNHALAHAVRDALAHDGHAVVFHDLHAEGFDPVLPPGESASTAVLPAAIQAHCDELQAADGIVVVHPNWWGQPPAILKGWIDRVIRPGIAYRFDEGDGGEGVPVGLLRAREAIVLNTSNTSDEREHRIFGDPLEAIWKHCIFGLCGVGIVHRRTFSVVVTSPPDQRQAWLAEATALCRAAFPPPPVEH
jgi:NAD(P)H dehydrogenase (quinone)